MQACYQGYALQIVGQRRDENGSCYIEDLTEAKWPILREILL